MSNLFSVSDAYGGVCKELASNLTKSGWRVTTTSSSTNRFFRPLDMLATIWRKHQNYAVAQIDVFSGAAFRWAELSVFALKHLRKPVVLTLHGGNLPEFAAKHPSRVTSLFRQATMVVTPSRYLLDAMLLLREDIRMLPNPITIDQYPFCLRMSPKPRLLYLRALHKIYNPSLAVHVAGLLQESSPEIGLTIAGPDKGDGSLEDVALAIQKAGLSDHVDIIGAVQKADVPVIMSKSDIFINTTNYDNTPISVIEAMASGLCIVSTNVGGIPYLLEHEYDALVVPPNDPEAMAFAVRRILTEPGLAERLSRNARSKAEQFDWSVILPKWETVLLQAASSSEREIT